MTRRARRCWRVRSVPSRWSRPPRGVWRRAAASLLLTPDPSLGHAAAALGPPVVVMLPTGHEPLVPAGVDGIHLFGEGGQIRSIAPDRVERAVLEMLARVAPPSPAPAAR